MLLRTALIVCLATGLFAQAPEFEAASVKPNTSGMAPRVSFSPGRLRAEGVPLSGLIRLAYKVRSFQIEGAPGWAGSERYDIDAETDGANGVDAMLLMTQTLLEDRFQLKVHRETKGGAVYLLTVGKGGAKMREASCVLFDPNHLLNRDQGKAHQCGGVSQRNEGPEKSLDSAGLGMEDSGGPAFQSIAGQLSLSLDRPVVNKTGLRGPFEVHLKWTDDRAVNPSDDGGPSIFTAVQEQLGLKLESGKGPVEYLVVDGVEKLREN